MSKLCYKTSNGEIKKYELKDSVNSSPKLAVRVDNNNTKYLKLKDVTGTTKSNEFAVQLGSKKYYIVTWDVNDPQYWKCLNALTGEPFKGTLIGHTGDTTCGGAAIWVLVTEDNKMAAVIGRMYADRPDCWARGVWNEHYCNDQTCSEHGKEVESDTRVAPSDHYVGKPCIRVATGCIVDIPGTSPVSIYDNLTNKKFTRSAPRGLDRYSTSGDTYSWPIPHRVNGGYVRNANGRLTEEAETFLPSAAVANNNYTIWGQFTSGSGNASGRIYYHRGASNYYIVSYEKLSETTFSATFRTNMRAVQYPTSGSAMATYNCWNFVASTGMGNNRLDTKYADLPEAEKAIASYPGTKRITDEAVYPTSYSDTGAYVPIDYRFKTYYKVKPISGYFEFNTGWTIAQAQAKGVLPIKPFSQVILSNGVTPYIPMNGSGSYQNASSIQSYRVTDVSFSPSMSTNYWVSSCGTLSTNGSLSLANTSHLYLQLYGQRDDNWPYDFPWYYRDFYIEFPDVVQMDVTPREVLNAWKQVMTLKSAFETNFGTIGGRNYSAEIDNYTEWKNVVPYKSIGGISGNTETGGAGVWVLVNRDGYPVVAVGRLGADRPGSDMAALWRPNISGTSDTSNYSGNFVLTSKMLQNPGRLKPNVRIVTLPSNSRSLGDYNSNKSSILCTSDGDWDTTKNNVKVTDIVNSLTSASSFKGCMWWRFANNGEISYPKYDVFTYEYGDASLDKTGVHLQDPKKLPDGTSSSSDWQTSARGLQSNGLAYRGIWGSKADKSTNSLFYGDDMTIPLDKYYMIISGTKSLSFDTGDVDPETEEPIVETYSGIPYVSMEAISDLNGTTQSDGNYAQRDFYIEFPYAWGENTNPADYFTFTPRQVLQSLQTWMNSSGAADTDYGFTRGRSYGKAEGINALLPLYEQVWVGPNGISFQAGDTQNGYASWDSNGGAYYNGQAAGISGPNQPVYNFMQDPTKAIYAAFKYPSGKLAAIYGKIAGGSYRYNAPDTYIDLQVTATLSPNAYTQTGNMSGGTKVVEGDPTDVVAIRVSNLDSNRQSTHFATHYDAPIDTWRDAGKSYYSLGKTNATGQWKHASDAGAGDWNDTGYYLNILGNPLQVCINGIETGGFITIIGPKFYRYLYNIDFLTYRHPAQTAISSNIEFMAILKDEDGTCPFTMDQFQTWLFNTYDPDSVELRTSF